jgi:hypothetical protein
MTFKHKVRSMKIEKKKVSASTPISCVAKSAIAAALGVTAALNLNACDNSTSASDNEKSKNNSEPQCDANTCGKNSSSSSEAESSSSSNVIDIPKSYEHYSSSAIEALSSAALSSSSTETPTSVDNPQNQSSSSVEQPNLYPNEKILIPRVHLCEDPNDPRCLIDSMVTTFEQDDIQA